MYSRWCARSLAALIVVSMCFPGVARADLKAFPGAEGFGSMASGGRGGEVYIVTNRNDSGTGSLRDALSTSGATPRTIVFATGGTIDLSSRITVNSKSNITIAGQTAPGDGILIRGDAFSFNDCSNLIIRHVRFRHDASEDRDAVSVSSGTNIIFDHCSVSWGRDETLSLTNASTNITVQDCIIAEGRRTDHQYGSLIASTAQDGRITLFATSISARPAARRAPHRRPVKTSCWKISTTSSTTGAWTATGARNPA